MTTMRYYMRPVSTWWWVTKRTYFIFVMRELSSVFVAWFVMYLLLLARAIGRGEAAYQNFLDVAGHPAVIALNTVALIFDILHTITWFSLTPQAMRVRLRARVVPASVIIASQYVGLGVVSAFIYWLVTR